MPVTRIRFGPRESVLFIDDVKARVAAYFEKNGLSPKADVGMVAKTVILLVVTFGAYGLILSNTIPPLGMLGLAVLMGAGMAGIGFCIAHDALHGAYSHSARVNRLLGFSFDLMGANGYMWKITHNVIHHTYTNIPGIDEDLAVSPLLRLSPEAPLKRYHRFQHWYAFLAYGFATLNWVFLKDYQQFLKRDIGPYKNRRHPRGEIATLIVGKLIYYGYTIVVPLLVLRIAWWQFAIGFVAMHLTAGIILGVVFQLAHVVEGTEYPQPDASGRVSNAWQIHEMETTADFAQTNRWLSWYIGGLNFQIEHHLFPHVCSIHYPALCRIVRETAEEHGVTYNCQPTLFAAIRSHYMMLKRLGRDVGSALPASPDSAAATVHAAP